MPTVRKRRPCAHSAICASALFAALLPGGAARAEPDAPRFAVGAAPHLLLGLTESCSQDVDVVECVPVATFAGGDVGVWGQLLPALGVGLRFAASRDLDRTRAVSSGGPAYDPADQRLWRTTAEVRLSPLPKARGFWLSLAGGWARLRDQSETVVAMDRVVSDQVSRDAALVGVGIGYDVRLGKSFRLAPELRGDVIFFGAPPELRPNVSGRDYGTSFWLEHTLRLAYVF